MEEKSVMKIFLVLDVLAFVLMAIFLIREDSVSWWHVIAGFVMGTSLHEVLTFFRDRDRPRNQRKLR